MCLPFCNNTVGGQKNKLWTFLLQDPHARLDFLRPPPLLVQYHRNRYRLMYYHHHKNPVIARSRPSCTPCTLLVVSVGLPVSRVYQPFIPPGVRCWSLRNRVTLFVLAAPCCSQLQFTCYYPLSLYCCLSRPSSFFGILFWETNFHPFCSYLTGARERAFNRTAPSNRTHPYILVCCCLKFLDDDFC